MRTNMMSSWNFLIWVLIWNRAILKQRFFINRSFKSEMPYLRELHMTNMPNLTYIASGSMSTLIVLKEVYLGRNHRLSSIDPDTFSSRRVNGGSEQWPPIIKVSVMWHVLKYGLVYVCSVLFFTSHGLFCWQFSRYLWILIVIQPIIIVNINWYFYLLGLSYDVTYPVFHSPPMNIFLLSVSVLFCMSS